MKAAEAVPGMGTTTTELRELLEEACGFEDSGYLSKFGRLCRDDLVPNLLAEVARLSAALAEANQSFAAMFANHTIQIGEATDEITRLTAALAEKQRVERGGRYQLVEAAARAEERERCAKVADDLGDSDRNDTVLHNDTVSFGTGYEIGCRDVATAIRSQS